MLKLAQAVEANEPAELAKPDRPIGFQIYAPNLKRPTNTCARSPYVIHLCISFDPQEGLCVESFRRFKRQHCSTFQYVDVIQAIQATSRVILKRTVCLPRPSLPEAASALGRPRNPSSPNVGARLGPTSTIFCTIGLTNMCPISFSITISISFDFLRCWIFTCMKSFRRW